MTHVTSDLFTPDEVRAMVRACSWSADSSLITMLYEGGFRIGEVCTLCWRNLTFDGFSVIVTINFKTMKPRHIRLIMAREYLAQTRADDPGVPEGDVLVFLNRSGSPLTYPTVTKRLHTIATCAGITRHFKPHIARHSRITHLIMEGLSESVITMRMWGSVSTTQFKTTLTSRARISIRRTLSGTASSCRTKRRPQSPGSSRSSVPIAGRSIRP